MGQHRGQEDEIDVLPTRAVQRTSSLYLYLMTLVICRKLSCSCPADSGSSHNGAYAAKLRWNERLGVPMMSFLLGKCHRLQMKSS